MRRRAGLGARRGGPRRATATRTGARRTLAARTIGAGRNGGGQLTLATDDVALVDPHLHADAAEGRLGLVQAVVDVGAQRVQRHAALAVELRAAHLGAAEAARALHPDALDVGLTHRGLDGLAHRAAERHAVAQLLGDALGHQLGLRLRVLHLEDVQLDLLAGQLLQVGTDAVGLGAAAADDDARPGGVDVDADPVAGALDLHVGDAGALETGGQQPTDRDVFLDVVLVLLVGVPPGLPVGGDTEPEAVGVDLLAHYSSLPSLRQKPSASFRGDSSPEPSSRSPSRRSPSSAGALVAACLRGWCLLAREPSSRRRPCCPARGAHGRRWPTGRRPLTA